MMTTTMMMNKGDSGGAFQVLSRDMKTWTIQGIVSLSPRKHSTFFCDPFKYTIFTKIEVYIKWIKHILDEIEAMEENVMALENENFASLSSAANFEPVL